MTDLRFDTILHIGAGTGAAVAGWLDAGARQVILVEPNPTYAAVLARLAATHPQVQVIEAAVADHDGEGLLRLFNVVRHSSLANATGLADLLPGLRQTALVPVALLSPASLLNRIAPDPGTAALIVDAPGSEVPILQGFQAAGAFQWLAAVELICTEEPQYDGAVGRPALQALLEDAGFTLTEADLSDPDWPHLTFAIDQNARQIAALAAELGNVRQTAAGLALQLAEEKAVSAALMRDHQEANATVLHQQQTAQQTVTLVSAELAATYAEVERLRNALAEAEDGSAATQQETAILRNALDSAQSERFSTGRQIEVLERLLSEEQTARRGQAVALQRQARLLDDGRDALQAQILTLESALAERDQALAVAAADRTALVLQLQQAQIDLGAGAEHQHAITRLNDRIKQLEHRHGLVRDELRRSEGQLDLIKDLLLRGDRL